MNYRCPICNGSGMVEPNFGGPATGTSKTCPGCNGTGMQWRNESVSYPEQTTTIIRKPCRKQYKPDYFRDFQRFH
jgi:hypothetical protein